jgi:hypothetical protein
MLSKTTSGAAPPARLLVDEQERQRILALATDFPSVWHNPQTPQRERKRMLALLIEDVTLTNSVRSPSPSGSEAAPLKH